ncbi:hypothetical protein, partial [Xanthomarina gelatinilytica]
MMNIKKASSNRQGFRARDRVYFGCAQYKLLTLNLVPILNMRKIKKASSNRQGFRARDRVYFGCAQYKL